MLVPIPELGRARRLLCIQPHYDDNDLGAGGTITTLAERGAQVVYLTVADDLLGVLDATLPAEAATKRIQDEQRMAGQVIGVSEQIRLELPDAGRWDEIELRDRIARELRRVNPDFVLTVDPWLATEAHRDHTRTGLTALEAVLLYGLAALPHHAAGGCRLRRGRPARRGPLLHRPPQHVLRRGRRPRAASTGPSTPMPRSSTRRPSAVIHAGLEHQERRFGERAGCEFAEGLRVLHPAHLHCNPDAEEMESLQALTARDRGRIPIDVGWRPHIAGASMNPLKLARILILSTVMLALLGSDGMGCGPPSHFTARLQRTTYGIPHVTAWDYGGLGYGYGYAFAQDNLCELMNSLVEANGKRARYFGASTRNMERDFFYTYWSSPEVIDEFLAVVSPRCSTWPRATPRESTATCARSGPTGSPMRAAARSGCSPSTSSTSSGSTTS